MDGYVSLEVSPYLALRTEDTVAEARRLWKLVGRDNLMVKVPGTSEGTPAIKTLIGEGMNINVTLLFGQQAYKDVAEAFIAGLEHFKAKGGDVSRVASVASFFVSRIDSQIDKKIDDRVKVGGADVEDLKRLRGKVAIANAKLAYQHYVELTGSERWKTLAAAGAMPQRLLWASTGVKDQGLPRHALCGGADRPRHRQHHAARHHGRLPRPRARQGSADRRAGRRRRRSWAPPSGSASTWTASPTRWWRTA